MNRKKIYNEKGYWKKRFKQLDLRVLQILNFERSGAIDVTLTDYFEVGNQAVNLGLTGESILDSMVQVGFADNSIVDMRNMINMVEVFSRRLKDVSESKWGRDLPNFPIYHCTVATVGDLVEKSKAIREMEELLEG